MQDTFYDMLLIMHDNCQVDMIIIISDNHKIYQLSCMIIIIYPSSCQIDMKSRLTLSGFPYFFPGTRTHPQNKFPVQTPDALV